jgi:hypothetical protein
MALTAKNSGSGTRVLAPEGVHRAACISVLDIGTQSGGKWGDKYKILFTWELVDELMDDGRPFVVSQRYTLSLSDKSLLRPMLQSWRGRAFTQKELEAFDVFNVLGKPCQVQILHKASDSDPSKVYANVASVMPLGKGMAKIAETQNPEVAFAFEEQKSGQVEIPEDIPDWQKDLIRNAPEYKALMGGQPARPQANGDGVAYDAVDEDEDSIPF